MIIFIDNVAKLAIENRLLEPLSRIFTPKTVRCMNDATIQSIAAEEPHIGADRQRLRSELKSLRERLSRFNIYSLDNAEMTPHAVNGMPELE